MSTRLVFTDGERYTIRDAQGNLYVTREPELYASTNEIREAARDLERSQYGLPRYLGDGMYCWDDGEPWSESEIAADARLIGWPADLIAPLLEVARIMAKYQVL